MTRTTRREDLITMGFALWTLVGLLVDAYYHSTDPSLESFWTPWHALFYSGFIATSLWLARISLKRSGPDGNILSWAPIGYKAALIGVGVFAVGGVGDAIWHTVFGVETSLDALLSPTHLLLFLGALLIVLAPFRAAWAGPDAAPSLRDFTPTLLSLTFATTLVAFFFEYVWGPTETWMMRVPYVPNSGNSELIAALAVVAVLTSTLIMFVPLLLASRRWRLPFGSATFILTFVTVAIALGFDEDIVGLPAAVLGGVVFDVLVQARSDRRLLATAPTATLWITYYVIIGQTDSGLALAPEIWAGAIVFAVLATSAIELIMRLVADMNQLPVSVDP